MKYIAAITLIIAAIGVLAYLMATTSRAMEFPQPQTHTSFECYMISDNQQVCLFSER